ncbi:NAD(P)H-binding protein [Mycobacterium sp. CBMA293]|uniref:NmrA family NAD(P)-binding protein n=1 Tax=unclassified Mycolicibacterium TaxID=2636767 RepID=UPI0012DF29AB|nr:MULTISPECIES: NmrA family NAD(P)-binding protein [unclassified Mycolicibacterium]MUL46625.1 NAD(P)H-binding protein [Mycolicibacterium sp. CBMA 360]MUL59074.1 NAD(P)H-binding protein [Mycolicibacterium sp. CBMA 335]MUL69468.1 NAD(P)H-binding protein [Mycolicibacterium sp. CBMA 311]MUL94432.1 NAD(P)H-binding protein [Mycolicibacterium sp. CBMA 230]MUM06551.1 NmrA family protein [Mycolicibacterium sp. CBMA 213]
MDNAGAVLVLGGTGRTGSRVAQALTDQGVPARTASRSGSEVRFDWDDQQTYLAALGGVDRVYLVPPTMRVRFADRVAAFFDVAADAGVHHVTLLSAHGSDRAPSVIDLAETEELVAGQEGITHTVLRPAWVMQNFTDEHLPLVDDALMVPSGGGAEAFVDADDIAGVAVRTLLEPAAHDGATYSLTGPAALTFAEIAEIITEVAGRPIRYVDIDQKAWIDGAVAAGVPADYTPMLRWLTGTVIDGHGAVPIGDVERVLGRPATDFAAFARRNATAWTL